MLGISVWCHSECGWHEHPSLLLAIQLLKPASLVSNITSYSSQCCTVEMGAGSDALCKVFELKQSPPLQDGASFGG